MSYGRFAAPHWRLHPITRRPNSPVSPGLHSRGGSYIPFVGAALVWIPAAIYLAIQGAYARAGALVVVGIVLSMVIDELVRNMIVGKASKVHSLIMFFSVIGGIQFFGLIGIVAGPLVLAVALTLLETYRNDTAAPSPIATERSEGTN